MPARAAATSSIPAFAASTQADAILLIGTNPRWESPVLNARIRKRYLHGGCPIGSIGPAVDLTYPVERLGAGPATLRELVDGKRRLLREAEGGQEPADHRRHGRAGARRRRGGAGAWRASSPTGWAPCAPTGTALPCCIPRRRASAVSISASCRARAVATWRASWPAARSARSTWSICSPPTRSTPARLGKAFVIYQGHHGDAGAHRADVILPGAAYTEKPGTYVNTEGRVQLAFRAGYPPGDAREDWAILRALSRASRQDAAVRHAEPGPRAAGGGEQELRRARPAGSGRLGQLRQARRPPPTRRSSRRSPTST